MPKAAKKNQKSTAQDDNSVGVFIHGQYVKDFSFENPNAPECFSKEGQPNTDVSIDVMTHELDQNVFEVIVSTTIKADVAGEPLFLLELKYAGIFEVRGPENVIPELLLVKCPEILFPFVRRIVFTSTSEGGFMPLTLQPLDFMSLYVQKLQNEKVSA